jgi:tetratricopeptide (TPR) repeat protein
MLAKMVLRKINCGTFRLIRIFTFLFAFVVLTAGCNLSAQKIEFDKATKASEAKDYKTAVEHYDNVVKHYVKTDIALQAAGEAGRLSYYELKDFPKAVEYFRHVILYSKDASVRLLAQKNVAELYLSNIQNFQQAIVEFNRLLELPHSKTEDLTYRLSIAKCYFYMNNFFQALVESDGILKRDYDPKALFDAMELKANVLLQQKNYDDAIAVLKEILVKYPESSKERQIGLVLTVCYEEKKDFAKAIETLESIKDTYPSKDFIEARIKNLKERQSYLPGAKGLRK